MDFGRAEYRCVPAATVEGKLSENGIPQSVYVYKGSNGVTISCAVENDTSPDAAIIKNFVLTAEYKDETIGCFSGIVISTLEILNDPHDPYLWCDGENNLLSDMYLCMLRYALPMEYVRFFGRYVPRDEVDRANAVSKRFHDYLCKTPYIDSCAAFITHISVAEKFRDSGLLSIMDYIFYGVFDICAIAVCINPLVVTGCNEKEVIWSRNDDEKEKDRMFKIAKRFDFDVHNDFLHDTTGDDTMIATWSSDYLAYFLEDEDFSKAIEAIDTAFEMDPEKTVLFPEDD